MSDDESMLDPEVSAMYRATANERCPDSLDERILAAAAAASRWQRRRWLIPAALAATVVLGLGVGLRLADTGYRATGSNAPGHITVDAVNGTLTDSGPCAGRRGTPDEWRLCINELRQTGDTAAASSEEAALTATVPPDVAGR